MRAHASAGHGATGKVGHAVARALLERGDEVRALVRDPGRASAVLPPGVEPVRGRRDRPRLGRARGGGLRARLQRDGPARAVGRRRGRLRPRQRARDRDGRARGRAPRARAASSTRRTIDVFHAERGHGASTRRDVADYPKGTAYERSKQRAEQLALAAAAETGIELVIVNPAAVYGPGPGGGRDLARGGAAAAGRRGQPQRGAAAAARRHAARLLDRPRRRPAAGRRARRARRALHPLRRPHELPRAGRDGGAARRPRAGAAGDAGAARAGRSRPPARPVSRVVRKPPLLPRGQLHFFLWDAAPAVRQGAAGAGLGAHAARGGPAPRWWRRLAEVRRGRAGGLPEPPPGCSTTAPPTCTTASPAAASARCALLERSLAEPGNASSARGRLGGRAGRARRRRRWPRSPSRRRSSALGAFLRLALRSAPPWRWPRALRLYWVGGRAAPDPAGARLLRRRARHRPGRSAGAAPPPRCSRRRSARRRARGLRAVALDTTDGQRRGARAVRARGLRGGGLPPGRRAGCRGSWRSSSRSAEPRSSRAAPRRPAPPRPRSARRRTAARASGAPRPRRPGTRPRGGRSARGRSSSGGSRAGTAWCRRRARASR